MAKKDAVRNLYRTNRNLLRAEQYAQGQTKVQLADLKASQEESFAQAITQSRKTDGEKAAEVKESYRSFQLQAEERLREEYAALLKKREADYQRGVSLLQAGDADDAIQFFRKTAESGYLDADEKIQECILLQKAQQEAAAREKAHQEAIRLKEEAACKKKKQTIGILCGIAAVAAIAVFLVLTQIVIPGNQYQAAQTLMENGQYEEAIAAFEALGGFRDSAQRCQDAQKALENMLLAEELAAKQAEYEAACQLLENGNYTEAIMAFEALGSYEDAAMLISEAYYRMALNALETREYQTAFDLFKRLGDYQDSAAYLANFKWGSDTVVADKFTCQYYYNEQNSVIRSETVGAEGLWYQTAISEYEYDGNGMLREIITTFRDSQGECVRTIVEEYDDHLNITREETVDAESTDYLYTWEYTYKDNGNVDTMVERKYKREDKNKEYVPISYGSVIFYSYEDNGDYTAVYEVEQEIQKCYMDEYGNLLRSETFDQNGNLKYQSEWENTYNAEGLLTILESDYVRAEYEYDEYGNVISYIAYSNGELQFQRKYTYRLLYLG